MVEIGSTLANDIHLDVCSSCHPFYTGKQKTIDSGGRVERFRFWYPHQRGQLIDLFAGGGFVQHLHFSLVFSGYPRMELAARSPMLSRLFAKFRFLFGFRRSLILRARAALLISCVLVSPGVFAGPGAECTTSF